MAVELVEEPEPDLEPAVCLTGRIAHLIRRTESKAVCGTWPVLRLSRMEDWQAAWRERAACWDICSGCAALAADELCAGVAQWQSDTLT